MTKHLHRTTAGRPPRPTVVALLRSPTLIGAAWEQLALPRERACDIQLATTPTQAQRLLENPTTALLLVELDEPNGETTKSNSRTAPTTVTNTADTLCWLQQQHATHSKLMSVAFSHHCDANTVVSALCAGTSGYLVNDPVMSANAQINDLLQGLEQLAAGKPPVSDAVLPHLVQAVRASQKNKQTSSAYNSDATAPVSETAGNSGDARDACLSKRETEVLALAAKGFTYAEMAGLLDLSVHTISTHTRRIYAKLEVNSRCAAIYEATRQGLLLEPSAT